MFFAGPSFESPFGPLFDFVLRPFSDNISTKMPTEGQEALKSGLERGSYLRSLRASSRKGGDPGGAVSGARRLLPESLDQYIISFWATSGGTTKE